MGQMVFVLILVITALSPDLSQAQMSSTNYQLDVEPVGVSGRWVESTGFSLYSTIGMPPVVSENPISTPASYSLQYGVDASLVYLDPSYVNTGVLSLSKGWNLLGNGKDFPLNVATIFADSNQVTTVWKWNSGLAMWEFYSPKLAGQSLIDYAASKGYNVLTTINGGEGFWVNAAMPFTVTLPNGAQILSIDFKADGKKALLLGWNMISVGENTSPADFNLSLGDTPPAPGVLPINLITLWAWENSQALWYFYAPALDSNYTLQSYVQAKGYLDFATTGKILGQGVGFWVNRP